MHVIVIRQTAFVISCSFSFELWIVNLVGHFVLVFQFFWLSITTSHSLVFCLNLEQKLFLGQGHGMHCQGYFNVRTFCARLVCHNGHTRTERSIVLCLKYCKNIKLYLNNNLIITLIILD